MPISFLLCHCSVQLETSIRSVPHIRKVHFIEQYSDIFLKKFIFEVISVSKFLLNYFVVLFVVFFFTGTFRLLLAKMISVFGSLKSGLLKTSEVNIDNNVCKLHYRVTVLVLIAFSILVTSRQYIGDPIECTTTSQIPSKMLDQYCWISSTFTLPKAFDKKVGVDVPHPGIDKHTPGEERTYHQYYQWVCFVLFLQAAMFYVPHFVWKSWEGGLLRALVSELKSPICPKDVREERRKLLVSYFDANFHNHNLYFAKFLVCEILNLVNVVGQIYFTNRFLGGEFTTYGTEVIQFTEWNQENRADPMVRIFPRVTKCIFHTFGTSGDVQKHDALCVLPINIINEKIYVFLWFWLVILSVITGLAVGYRFFILAFPHMRFFLLRMHAKVLKTSQMEVIIHKSQVGDWFLLYQMSKNMDFAAFVDFLGALGSKLEGNTMVKDKGLDHHNHNNV